MTPLEQANNEPLTWLLQLEMARQRADAAKLVAAQVRLAELGIRVIYGNPSATRGGNRDQARRAAHAG